jgi:hypothetical protein
MQIEVVADQYSDQLWRLNNLYWIQNKFGQKVKIELNTFQMRLFEEMHYLNTILKARQFGFTTFIDLFGLDCAIWNANTSVGIIAHNLDDAKKIFRSKIQFPFKNLPEGIRNSIRPDTSKANEYVFANDSSISVSTSFRSGTLQILHVSEFGKIAAKYPEKAKEIKSGAFEAVAVGQIIFVESTAEGRAGEFYDQVEYARQLADKGVELSPMDFKFHFFPWHENPEYREDSHSTSIPQDMQEYFESLKEEHGIIVDRGQQIWYVKKAQRLGDLMKREYPSTPDEAFESAIDGSYYGKIIQKLRIMRRITKVPYDPLLPVHTFWDLGINDENAIWFYQNRGAERRLIDYYENSGEGMAHYARILSERGYIYGQHYMPHDAGSKSIQTGKSTVDVARGMGISPVVIVPRAKNQEGILSGIEQVRNMLMTCWIDEEKCSKGIEHLEHYRKEWDDKLASFKRTPLHDAHSNGADSLRTGAVGLANVNHVSSSALLPEYHGDY